MNTPTLTQRDAVMILLVASDAFAGLIDSRQEGQPEDIGIVLLYDAIIQRVRPLLSATTELDTLFAHSSHLSAKIREVAGLPSHQ